jgi:hypothetical protein
MQYDRRGLAVTTESGEAVAHLDAAIRSVLGHRLDASDYLAQALALDPDLALVHLMAGFGQMLLGRSELIDAARACAERARRAIAGRGGTPRERGFLQALDAWLAGDMEVCAARLDSLVAAGPHDALAFKLSHAVRFMLGDIPGMRLVSEVTIAAWSPGMPDYGYILGCHAFALEETGSLDAAERAGRQAVERETLDAWGCHAVAHVFETRRRPDLGIAWLASQGAQFAGVNNFGRHLAWHEALFHLAQGDIAAVLELYDRKIRAEHTDDYRDVANAASLLWRLERAGLAVAARWDELADIAERRILDQALAFAQLHYAMALAGAGRWRAAQAMISAMRPAAAAANRTQRRILSRLGPALVEIMLGLKRSDVELTPDAAAALCFALPTIGGSNAQRDVFVGMLGDAAAAGRPRATVRSLADERLRRRAVTAVAALRA